MNILLIEDNGFIGPAVKNKIEKLGHTVITANKIAQAMDILNSTFDLIIVDLHVNPIGLNEKEQDESELSGWTWLKYYVLKDESWRKKIIIYSKYISILKDEVDHKDLHGLVLVEKNTKRSDVEFNTLLDSIARFEK